MKTKEKEEAINLRNQGCSIKEIALKLNVSKSSASRWVSHIELTNEQIEELKNRMRVNGLNGATRQKQLASERQKKYRQDGKRKAKNPSSLYIAGCMLWWAEGTKDKNSVAFANSDPDMIVLFKKFLQECFGVKGEDFRLQLSFYDDLHSEQEIVNFWLKKLELSRMCLTKSQVNQHSSYSKNKRKGCLPYGTCRLSVHNTKIVQTIMGSVEEIGGFLRYNWTRAAMV